MAAGITPAKPQSSGQCPSIPVETTGTAPLLLGPGGGHWHCALVTQGWPVRVQVRWTLWGEDSLCSPDGAQGPPHSAGRARPE